MLLKTPKPRVRIYRQFIGYTASGLYRPPNRVIVRGGGVGAIGETVNGAFKNWWSLYLESNNRRQSPHAVEGLPLDWRSGPEE